jgi:hypothetical protein
MKRRFKHLHHYLRHNRFVVAVLASIGISLLLVTVSLAIYVRDGVVLLDLSRPSYAPVRDKIKKDDDAPAFESEGKIDAAVVKDFRTQLDWQTKEIDKLGGFDASAISDTVLQLKP